MMRRETLEVKSFIPLKAFSTATCLMLHIVKNKYKFFTNQHKLQYKVRSFVILTFFPTCANLNFPGGSPLILGVNSNRYLTDI